MNTSEQQTDWLDDSQPQILSKGFPEKMVLLDCETTGGRASYHRITEIGLLVIEAGVVIAQWQSLVNPERVVPPGITRLTGITNAMVKTAPTFNDLAPTILEMLSGRILVAHHARFDYGFLKREFERAGYKFNTKPLCSVKFSRLLYPQFKRHGLDQIIARFKLNIEKRHRAMDDALMIYLFFLKSSHIHPEAEIMSACQQLLKDHTLPAKLPRSEVDKLPKSAGVYYFYDDQDRLLYVGKSVNIKQRVLSHFSQDHKNHKDMKMSETIAHIDFTQTVSDFGAQLLESSEIKTLKPLYNSRLRRIRRLFRMTTNLHPSGFLYPSINPVNIEDSDHLVQDNYGLFRSPKQAQRKLQKLADEFQLCHQILGIENTAVVNEKPCFRYQLNKCLGACCGEESYQAHNARLLKALQGYHQKVWPWEDAVLIEERDSSGEHESMFHLVDQWVYLGKITSFEALLDSGFVLRKGNLPVQSHTNSNISEEKNPDHFDLDVYFILVRFLLDKEKLNLNNIHIHPLRPVAENPG